MPAGFKREVRVSDGYTFIKCPQCLERKLAIDAYRCKGGGSLGFSSPCRLCQKDKRSKYCKTERAKEVARNYRISIEGTDIEKKIKENKRIYQKKYREKNKDKIKKELAKRGYKNKVNRKTVKRIEKLGIRPMICPICGREGDIQAHHPNYDKRYEIIFCCTSCHQRIHAGRFAPEVELTNIKNEARKFYLQKIDEWIEKL